MLNNDPLTAALNIAIDARKPSAWLNYPNDVRSIVGEVKGPNALGEYLTAVTADYDAETNTTRVGFAYTTVRELVEARAT